MEVPKVIVCTVASLPKALIIECEHVVVVVVVCEQTTYFEKTIRR